MAGATMLPQHVDALHGRTDRIIGGAGVRAPSGTLARAGLATALVPRTAIDPATPGIRTAPVADHPILRLLFAATRHTGTANPTTAAVVTALRTAARENRTPSLPPA
ncbi:hypothetical protein OR263_10545 [Streptomyces sp. NEAU-H22]|uniref:hypothetical protein n=1 Tax=Streptomyces sp. NEAU-H22 TaxID=2994655 RepID=UPI00225062C4|nr:hypothetical protein [Streptomyces sp. NEAU-H22]MCX3287144.1 hypothetical protein [Streptomyces sp. NEAU-H22]